MAGDTKRATFEINQSYIGAHHPDLIISRKRFSLPLKPVLLRNIISIHSSNERSTATCDPSVQSADQPLSISFDVLNT